MYIPNDGTVKIATVETKNQNNQKAIRIYIIGRLIHKIDKSKIKVEQLNNYGTLCKIYQTMYKIGIRSKFKNFGQNQKFSVTNKLYDRNSLSLR